MRRVTSLPLGQFHILATALQTSVIGILKSGN